MKAILTVAVDQNAEAFIHDAIHRAIESNTSISFSHSAPHVPSRKAVRI